MKKKPDLYRDWCAAQNAVRAGTATPEQRDWVARVEAEARAQVRAAEALRRTFRF